MIILKGNNNETLSISLYDILIQIENFNYYKWKILWIEGISLQLNMLEFENIVNKSEDGLLVTPQELLDIAKKIDQLIELVLIGDEDENNLHKLEDDVSIKQQCLFFIELVDSSYWEISSKDKSYIENFE